MPDQAEFREHLKPGNRVWIKVWDPDKAKLKGPKSKKDVFIVYGGEGDMAYAGYQHIGTSTYLLFDHTTGSGKKTQIETIMLNADTVKLIGKVAVHDEA